MLADLDANPERVAAISRRNTIKSLLQHGLASSMEENLSAFRHRGVTRNDGARGAFETLGSRSLYELEARTAP